MIQLCARQEGNREKKNTEESREGRKKEDHERKKEKLL